jgi:HK97 family phage portal protein
MAILPRIASMVPKGWLAPFVSQHYSNIGHTVKANWPIVPSMGSGWIGAGDMGPPGEWQTRNRGHHPDNYASFSAVYTCTQIISGDIAKLPINFFNLNADGTRTLNRRYPLNNLLLKPNPYQNRLQFIQNFVISYLMAGNTFVYLRRDARNMINRMDVLDPRRVVLYVTNDGEIFYRIGIHPLAGIHYPIMAPARDILHHRLIISPSYPLMGVTPIYAAAASTQTGQQIMGNAQVFFGNSARPGGALTAPGKISEELATRLERDWDNSYGNSRSGKTAVLGEGLTFVPISMSYVDAQVIEQLRFSIEDVARAFRVPGFMIGDLTKTTFRNTEQTNRTYLNSCLSYHIESIETALEDIFEIGGSMEVEFDLDEMLRTEIDLRYAAYGKALQGGWTTINEVRRAEGLPPIPNGDEPLVQAQMRRLSVVAEATNLDQAGGAGGPGGGDGGGDPPPEDNPPEEPPKMFDIDRTRNLLGNKLRARGVIHA